MFSHIQYIGKQFHSIVKKEQLFDFFLPSKRCSCCCTPAANLRTNVRVFRCDLGRRRLRPEQISASTWNPKPESRTTLPEPGDSDPEHIPNQGARRPNPEQFMPAG